MRARKDSECLRLYPKTMERLRKHKRHGVSWDTTINDLLYDAERWVEELRSRD